MFLPRCCHCVAGGQLERNKSKEPRAKSRARRNAREVHLAECGFQLCSGLPAPFYYFVSFFFSRPFFLFRSPGETSCFYTGQLPGVPMAHWVCAQAPRGTTGGRLPSLCLGKMS